MEINLTLAKRSIRLYRAVQSRVRYYSLSVEETLFGEYLFIKEFGSANNKKPTSILKEYFKSSDLALSVMMRVKELKIKKGYCLETS
jgi:predicted DNA-binding WGR domain protein